MPLTCVLLSVVLSSVVPGWIAGRLQPARVAELAAALSAPDAESRGRAACELREIGDAAAAAINPLVALLPDGAPLNRSVCERTWWRGGDGDTTSPGELAASALVAIGSRAYTPVVGALKSSAWIARRNAAWALGALHDDRAVNALIDALRDPEASVREQAAWALGAIGDRRAVDGLIPALKDEDTGVRRQAAWAIGAIGK